MKGYMAKKVRFGGTIEKGSSTEEEFLEMVRVVNQELKK